VAGPIAKTGAAVHELYSTWSAQSLGLDVADVDLASDDITWPEGWDLEYTEDGSTWVNWIDTPPTDLGAVIAIRSLGDVNTVGENMFKTTSDGELRLSSFAGSGGGDGYDVTVGDGMVFNMWHHQRVGNPSGGATVECHLYSGDLCPTAEFLIEGFESNHGSRVFYDEDSNKLYAYVYGLVESSDSYGVACIDYSEDVAVSCGYTELNSTTSDFTLEFDGEGGGPNQDYGSQSQDGDIIWSIQGTSGALMCFNTATASACSDNGWLTGETGNYAYDTARVTAVGGVVFWTIADKFGCYDPATDGLCGENNPIALIGSDVRHAPIPVENTSGTLLGACDYDARQCITTAGAALTFPTALGTFWDAWPTDEENAGFNMAQFAYANNRLYYDTSAGDGALGNWASNNITCYDFATEAACSGFDGFGREGIEYFYSATYDDSTPECLWINQDSGRIVPLNVTTGEVGCEMGNPVVELPYDAVTPRMSCNEDGRVTAWESLKVTVPAGVVLADVRVSFYDSIDPEDENDTSTAVDGWTNLTVDASGVLDLSGLTTAETGTQPSIRIEAGDISTELAQGISGTVTFVAEDPELCFALTAEDHCVTHIGTPSLGDIADGIVSGTSITRPTAGNDVGSAQTTTLPGQNADQMCAASALEIDLPISALASTGVDAGTIALGGFAVLAVGGAAIAVTRRRKG
jgi:hypothetical protein